MVYTLIEPKELVFLFLLVYLLLLLLHSLLRLLHRPLLFLLFLTLSTLSYFLSLFLSTFICPPSFLSLSCTLSYNYFLCYSFLTLLLPIQSLLPLTSPPFYLSPTQF